MRHTAQQASHVIERNGASNAKFRRPLEASEIRL
jgi:hypothetical protein